MEVDNINWVCVSNLGSGSFGIVQLWRNKRNGEEIAIKKCKSNSAQLTAKQKERWIHEVETMNGLRHQNIVASRPVPQEVINTEPSLPVLCMEFCRKGDLRQVLNDIENSCGLPEPIAIQVMLDISGAVEYLHGQSLTHRDLKPENVVLQQINDKVVYKLIDLGYAKVLSHASMCASIVGTMNYVAPELLWGRKYTCSVDYWSLGILFYEIITGTRPFLPDEDNPLAWRVQIEKKSYQDISARYVNGQVQFLQDIQDPTYISPNIRDELLNWFRIVLQWDSKRRGWQVDETGTYEVVVFKMLRRILSKKVVRVFSIPQYRIFSYEVEDSTTVRRLQSLIENDTQIMTSSQEFLNSSGEVLSADQILQNTVLTLFKKEAVLIDSPFWNIPALVSKMIESPKLEMCYYELKRCYSAAMFFVKQEVELFKDYILALCTKIDLINSRIDALSTKKSEMVSGINLLKAEFNSMSELLNSHPKNGFGKWQRKIQVASSKLEYLSAMVTEFEPMCDKFSRICGMLREFGNVDWMMEYDAFLNKVQNIAISSRSLPRVGKHLPTRMALLILKFLKFRHTKMNEEKLSKIGSQITLMTTMPVTEELSKLEKYVESAAALTTVYGQEISNLHKTWENCKKATSSDIDPENMDIEHNDDNVHLLMSSTGSNSKMDDAISNDVILDNLVIRYMMHDIMSETYEKFQQIVNLDSEEDN